MVSTREDVRSDIVSTIIRNKVLDAVVEKASISEMEPQSEEEQQEAVDLHEDSSQD